LRQRRDGDEIVPDARVIRSRDDGKVAVLGGLWLVEEVLDSFGGDVGGEDVSDHVGESFERTPKHVEKSQSRD
jgi:hypothetical protein